MKNICIKCNNIYICSFQDCICFYEWRNKMKNYN